MESRLSRRKNASVFFSGQGRMSLSRFSGETLVVRSTKSFFFLREKKTALKSGSSPLALLSFPKLPTPFALHAKAPASQILFGR